jgi:hypothetical protein
MRGVAEECNAALDPVRDRFTVAQNPQTPVGAVLDDALRAWMNMLEARQNFFMRDGLAGDRLRRVVVKRHNQVEDLPAG